jgi:hypothetical protein
MIRKYNIKIFLYKRKKYEIYQFLYFYYIFLFFSFNLSKYFIGLNKF